MISKKDLQKINNYLWEIPKSFRDNMKVPARIYASEKLLEDIFGDKSIPQLINTSALPGVVNYVLGMPDMHQGYGACIGNVGAMEITSGVISPSFIGFDENCGVRLLKSDYTKEEIGAYIEKLAGEIQSKVPSGVGKGRESRLTIKQLNRILEGGVPSLVEEGYGEKEDIENCEEEGKMKKADSAAVSSKAKNRGRDQIGTLGSGNHFLEIQTVEEIFNNKIANIFGLFKNQVVIMIHTGSRGFGHQNCTDYLKIAQKAFSKHKINLPDKKLVCMPFNSPEGERFFRALSAACNFAWANRHMISHYTRQVWTKVLRQDAKLKLLYDVAHNIAKIEEHEVDGEKKKLIVHRKGATRAFPPFHPEIPQKYQQTGQPVIIPGSMGTASYICAGIKESAESFYTVNHGAGRTMSRREATKKQRGEKIVENLKQKGVLVKSRSMRGVAEEAPYAYKDIHEVINIVQNANLAQKVAKLTPVAVIKGE